MMVSLILYLTIRRYSLPSILKPNQFTFPFTLFADIIRTLTVPSFTIFIHPCIKLIAWSIYPFPFIISNDFFTPHIIHFNNRILHIADYFCASAFWTAVPFPIFIDWNFFCSSHTLYLLPFQFYTIIRICPLFPCPILIHGILSPAFKYAQLAATSFSAIT